MANIRLAFAFLLFLTFLNFVFIFNHLFSSFNPKINSVKEKCPETSIDEKLPDKMIKINFDIMDIYRIDVSCEYLTRDLGSEISNEYVNRWKKCSFSSLNPQLNEKVEKSIRRSNKIDFVPILNESLNFDPFNDKTQEELFKNLELGGVWNPKIEDAKECELEDLDYVVFVVPFSSSRLQNLKFFLINIHSYLQSYRFSFKYRILIVEQKNMNNGFNKGRLFNAAVKHVLETEKKVDCIVLHDIDLIPSSDGDQLGEKGDYRCRKMPWHLSRKVFNLKTKEERVYNQFLTGGILSLRLDHFVKVNGFSNEYFGWGAEDDDFQVRMFNSKLCIMRPQLDNQKASFMMLPHGSSKANNHRFSSLSSALVRQKTDGLSNVKDLVKIISVNYYKSFTHISVNVKHL